MKEEMPQATKTEKKPNGAKGNDSESLGLQLKDQRRTVDFDTFDIQIQQLLTMLEDGQIWVAPAYQRKFRWSEKQSSQLIESLLLGIPVPSLFMATNADNTWEAVDGVQRLSSIAKFSGSRKLREKLGVGDALGLSELQKLTRFEGLRCDDLPPVILQHFKTRPLKVITLNDKSDKVVRYDLFERLNTGGVALSSQEIRDCVFQGEFADKLGSLAVSKDFRKVLKLAPRQQRDGTFEECVLRFFAFYDRYKTFNHSVIDFLNSYMKDSADKFDYTDKDELFGSTFTELARVFPKGLKRPGGKGVTPLNLYEGVAVGAALALQKTDRLASSSLEEWLGSAELRKFTTGATNSNPAVRGRIEFCRDRFLGKKYVSTASK